MPPLNEHERIVRARIAGNIRWARTTDRTAATAPARRGLRAKFAREIDPDGTLPPAELERRVDNLVRAHMLKMTLAASKARRAKSAGSDPASGAA